MKDPVAASSRTKTVCIRNPAASPLPPLPYQAEANQTIFLTYRAQAGYSLAPCGDFSAGMDPTATCAAAANDTADGDLSPFITATVSPLCPANATCNSCSVAGFTLGLCLPGRYRITYTVANSAGLTTTATLDVAVEQVTVTLLQLSLFPNRTAEGSANRTVADAFAANLAGNATARLELLAPVLEAFGIAQGSIRDISLTAPPEVLPVYLPSPAAPAMPPASPPLSPPPPSLPPPFPPSPLSPSDPPSVPGPASPPSPMQPPLSPASERSTPVDLAGDQGAISPPVAAAPAYYIVQVG